MKLLIDSCWRAAAYCLHPRVMLLSLLPLVLMIALSFGLGYFFWESAIDSVRGAFESWALLDTFFRWMDNVGMPGLKGVLAPLVVVFLATPVLVIVSLLAVAMLMAPALLKLVALRRFPTLERRHGGNLAGSIAINVSATLLALMAMVASIPLWFIPPLVLIVPPLIWGWLTYRVMSYDALSEHASADERRALMRQHRGSLLAIGVISGYLGAAPSLVWASGVLFVALAPVLVPVAIWIYTLVFAFSALWFAHFLLAALAQSRGETVVLLEDPVPPGPGAGPVIESPPLTLPPF
jgi:etoposide-induced protein 2.4 (EI24)